MQLKTVKRTMEFQLADPLVMNWQMSAGDIGHTCFPQYLICVTPFEERQVGILGKGVFLLLSGRQGRDETCRVRVPFLFASPSYGLSHKTRLTRPDDAAMRKRAWWRCGDLIHMNELIYILSLNGMDGMKEEKGRPLEKFHVGGNDGRSQ